MKRVLLHCCCAPCSSAIIEWMMANDIVPTLFYCNPNIYPEEEYLIRKNELTKYAEKLGLEVIDDDYDHQGWLNQICGLEQEPERGQRCLKCFKIRLLRAAQKAVDLGFDEFTTTLASSRWKSLDQINEAGEWAVEQVLAPLKSPEGDVGNMSGPSPRGGQEGASLHFDGRNWRKGGLQQRRNELLKENGFYNQQYCGCEFSLEGMKKKHECCK